MLVLLFGTRWAYLCTRNQTNEDMRNTDYSISALNSFLSSETSFQALKDIIDDLGLEVEEITSL